MRLVLLLIALTFSLGAQAQDKAAGFANGWAQGKQDREAREMAQKCSTDCGDDGYCRAGCLSGLPQTASLGFATGQLQALRRTLLQQCVSACGKDGNCQGACLNAAKGEPPRPVQQAQPEEPPKLPQTDPSCMSMCMNGKAAESYQACHVQCTR